MSTREFPASRPPDSEPGFEVRFRTAVLSAAALESFRWELAETFLDLAHVGFTGDGDGEIAWQGFVELGPGPARLARRRELERWLLAHPAVASIEPAAPAA